ncbi:MAG: hypothetical protein KGL52_03465 [Rhodospirillales bacterium]|nr:hypothetical protein [Rhodospirillales bacterium]
MAGERQMAYASPMQWVQWVFLVLALWAALVELHTGTFYLAAIAAVALLTVVLGFWVHPELLLSVFAAGCVGAMALVWIMRRRLPRGRGLADLDAGEEVTVVSVSAGGRRVVVSYRGTRWDAVIDKGPPLAVGDVAVIARKDGSLLHLGPPPGTAPHRPAPEST